MIKMKDDTVRVRDMSTALLFGLTMVHSMFQVHGLDVIITSLNDNLHGDKSLHHSGNAADIRSKLEGLSDMGAREIAQQVSADLGPDYDFIYETANPHFHLEYQPKRRFTP